MGKTKRYTMINDLVAMLLFLAFALLSFQWFETATVEHGKDDLERSMLVLRNLLRQKGTGFGIENGRLLVGDSVLNGSDIPDQVQEITGSTAAIFMGNQLVATSMVSADGSRATGSRLQGPAYSLVTQGKAFRGETNLQGAPYFTAYDPIKDSSGKVIGALYVGIKKDDFLSHFILCRTELLLVIFGLLAAGVTHLVLMNRLVKEGEDQKEEDLRFLQTLIDSIPNPIFYKDVQGRYLGCNKAYLECTGLSRERLIGKTSGEIFTEAQAEIGTETDRRALQNGGAQIFEMSGVYPDGTSHELVCYKASFPAPGGSPAGIIGSLLDITDRKKAERELRDSQQKLSQIFEFFPDPTMVIDREGVVVAWNRAMESLTGIASADMVGKGEFEYALPFYGERRPTLIDLVLAPSPELEAGYRQLERRGDILEGEAHIRQESGVEAYLHATAAPLRDAAGKVAGAIESIRDVTSRKQAEDALAEKERMLAGILDAVQDGICMLDDQLRIVRVNAFFEKMFSDRLPLTGKKCHEVFADRHDPCEGCTSLQALVSGEPTSRISCIQRGEEPRWFEIVSFPIFDPQREHVTGVVEHVRDVTKRKAAEDKLARLNEELERKVQERSGELLKAQEELVRREKLATLGQLSGIVSHELRNPLAVMSNAVYVLNMINKDPDGETRQYLDIIKNEIDNSLCIIGDLLDFSSARTPRIKPTPVSQLIDETLEKCTIPEGVELKVEVLSSLPLLKIDRLQVRQVLQNLVSNAVQAMPGGGTLRIYAGQEGESVRISVADSGEGIAPENLDKIFQPLFTTKPKGIGLGLVVCKNLTEGNGGTIEVYSSPGRETVFTITLPTT
ncbi:MAG TPA: PAS domain-containing protein [Geomonas sp.]|nr:PAS domain-containing protein [Geomonas sp.]